MPQLKIDFENGTCSADTMVRGTVQLGGHHVIEVSSLSINFLGRCQVCHVLGQGAVFDGNLILKLDKDLLEGPTAICPGESWKFEFKVPSLSTPQLMSELIPGFRVVASAMHTADPLFHKKGPTPRFNDDQLQKLPSAFASSNFFAGAKIEYGLQATLYFEGWAKRPKCIKEWKSLDFTVERTVDDPIPQTSLVSEPSLHWSKPQLEGHQVVPLYFRHKHRSANAASSLELEYPTVAVAGHNMALTLCVRHDLKTDSFPLVTFLRSISIRLITMTNINCLSIVHSSQKQRLIGKDKHLNEILEGRVEIGNLLSLRFPTDILPTFATPNVSRTHYLSFKVSIESDFYRKTSTFHFHSGELILLP